MKAELIVLIVIYGTLNVHHFDDKAKTCVEILKRYILVGNILNYLCSGNL